MWITKRCRSDPDVGSASDRRQSEDTFRAGLFTLENNFLMWAKMRNYFLISSPKWDVHREAFSAILEFLTYHKAFTCTGHWHWVLFFLISCSLCSHVSFEVISLSFSLPNLSLQCALWLVLPQVVYLHWDTCTLINNNYCSKFSHARFELAYLG